MVRHVVKALGVVDDLEPHVALRTERDAGLGHDRAPDDLLRAVGMDDHGDHAAGRLAHGNVHTGAADTLGHADGGGDSAARGLDGFNGRAVGTLLDRLHTAIGEVSAVSVLPSRQVVVSMTVPSGFVSVFRDRAVRVDDRFDLAGLLPAFCARLARPVGGEVQLNAVAVL